RRHTRWPRDWSSDVCSSDLRSTLTPLAEADQKGEDCCAAGEVKVILGEGCQGRPLDSHHPADEGVDRDQERELSPVRAEAELDRLGCLHRPAALGDSAAVGSRLQIAWILGKFTALVEFDDAGVVRRIWRNPTQDSVDECF